MTREERKLFEVNLRLNSAFWGEVFCWRLPTFTLSAWLVTTLQFWCQGVVTGSLSSTIRYPLHFRAGLFSDRMNTEGALHSAAKEEARYTRLPQMETLIAAVHSHTQVSSSLGLSPSNICLCRVVAHLCDAVWHYLLFTQNKKQC